MSTKENATDKIKAQTKNIKSENKQMIFNSKYFLDHKIMYQDWKFNSRLNDWVTYSHGLEIINPFLMLNMQYISYFDIDLIEEFQEIYKNMKTPSGAVLFTKHIALSQLWLFGAYEIIRTLSQKNKKILKINDKEITKKIELIKDKLNRIRVPLAKIEPSGKHSSTDYIFPKPIVNSNLGVGWKLNNTDFLFRKELSDELLDLLKSIYIFENKNTKQSF